MCNDAASKPVWPGVASRLEVVIASIDQTNPFHYCDGVSAVDRWRRIVALAEAISINRSCWKQ